MREQSENVVQGEINGQPCREFLLVVVMRIGESVGVGECQAETTFRSPCSDLFVG